MSSNQRSLDHWSGDAKFLDMADTWRRTRPGEWSWFAEAVMEMARNTGDRGFAIEDVVEVLGRGKVPRNLPGAVSGSLRQQGVLIVCGRRPSIHRRAKGRWCNLLRLNPAFGNPPVNPHAPPHSENPPEKGPP